MAAEGDTDEEEAPGELTARDFLVLTSAGSADPAYSVGEFLVEGQSEADATLVPVIAIAVVSDSLLIAVPFSFWHRTAARRKLPVRSLIKPIAVEVAAVETEDRDTIVDEANIKVWLALLKPEFESFLHFPAEAPCIFPTTEGEENFLPAADALVAVADERFSFLTAESGNPTAPGDGGDTAARLALVEEALISLKTSMAELAKKHAEPKPDPKTVTNPKASPAVRDVSGYAGLDPQVVRSALGAGIDPAHLRELSRIASAKKTKLTDAPVGVAAKPVKFDVLGEPLEEAGQEATVVEVDAEEVKDPFQRAVCKLTSIVETLAGQSKKKSRLLEDALDEVGVSQDAASSSYGHSTKRHSAVLRSLKKALTDSPEEIFQVIEKRMLDDFGSRAASPGCPIQGGSFRGWCEHRSRIPNINTTVRVAWSICGALDAARENKIEECKARLALLLCQLDQVAVDRGQWALASTGSLEEAPPFGSFARHSPPDYLEPQHTRLWPTIWAEALMFQVRELDDFMEKRSKLGKRSQFLNSEKPEETKGQKRQKGKGKGGGKGTPTNESASTNQTQ